VQPVDYTTLAAVVADLQQALIPARLEQVYQRDRTTLCLALRGLSGRRWLGVSWHRQAAGIALVEPPPKQPDTFTFSQQIWHQLGGLALVEVVMVVPWERLVALRFAKRPGDPIVGQIYVEVMGQYSNVILVNQEDLIVSAAHQVNERQSRLRTIQTGASYEYPPAIIADTPSLGENFASWHQKITLIPGDLAKTLLSLYRGLSSVLVRSLITAAAIAPGMTTDQLTETQWQQLFVVWRRWLEALDRQDFQPHWLDDGGYGVVDFGAVPKPTLAMQSLLQEYYGDRLAAQANQELRHQLSQRLQGLLQRLYRKRQDFDDRLVAATQVDAVRQQADLLMAHLHCWQPGMTQIELLDFESQEPVTIGLSPDRNAVQNAQLLYKRHQKLKRSRGAIDPLRSSVQAEIDYLEQVQTAIAQLDGTLPAVDRITLEEIRDELVGAGYLAATAYQRPSATADSAAQPHRFVSPSGHEILIGRNNRQNDQLTFRTATPYDLWFHTQQIPGSHLLLRLAAGSQPSDADLQLAADLATYFSQARESELAPIVYTQPKHLYRPKGAKLGMVIYQQETVLWGKPQRAKAWIEAQVALSAADA
jgi:predicted ribosome quality control (RQC) complex YloA/Tae2 family protein